MPEILATCFLTDRKEQIKKEEEQTMEIIKPKKRNDHPYIPELEDLYLKGRITRREFLRNATLLGVSVAGASAC